MYPLSEADLLLFKSVVISGRDVVKHQISADMAGQFSVVCHRVNFDEVYDVYIRCACLDEVRQLEMRESCRLLSA